MSGNAGRVVVLLAVAIGLTLSPAHPGERSIDGPGGGVSWSGEFENAATPGPDGCAALRCDVVRVEVRRPLGADLIVEIHTIALDMGYDLDLFVYDPGGALAAGSDASIAPDTTVLVPDPRPGVYEFRVVPKLVVGRVAYAGRARLERPASARPVRDLLPNLTVVPPRHPTFASGVSLSRFAADRGVRSGRSCYAEEEVDQGALRCLRFDQIIANTGPGPVELRFRGEEDGKMRQRIYRSDGSFKERVAGSIEFHVPHAHFHSTGFARSLLYRAEAGGTKGALVRTSRKQGFCMTDIENHRFGRPGSSPGRYPIDRVCTPNVGDEGPYTVAGISPGWADVYPWFLTEQYIEVSGVPDGVYVLELRVNLGRDILESTFADNAASTTIRIRGDSVEVVR